MLIYAVEDEASIQDLYTYSLKSAGMDVKCFESGEELFDALKNPPLPDLIILDIMLDGMNGYEILAKLKSSAALCGIRVIMISAKNEEISKVKGLDMGADDYISKPFGVLELISRVKANTRDIKKTGVVKYKDISVSDDAHEMKINGVAVNCTLKVYQLLKLLITRAETVVSRDELLGKIWGHEAETETRTLDMHIVETRKLLSEAESTAEIVTVRGIGYMLK